MYENSRDMLRMPIPESLTKLPARSSMDTKEYQVDREKNWLDTIKHNPQEMKLAWRKLLGSSQNEWCQRVAQLVYDVRCAKMLK